MSENHSQTHGDTSAYETLPETDGSPLRALLRSGILPLAIGALSLLGALRSGRSSPARTVLYTIMGGLLLGIGVIRRGQDGVAVDLGSSISIGDDEEDDATATTGSTATGTTTEELSDPEPPEDDTDADVSSTQVADESAEAAGPSSEDAVPSQTDETMPDETQSEDVSEVDPEEFGSDEDDADEGSS